MNSLERISVTRFTVVRHVSVFLAGIVTAVTDSVSSSFQAYGLHLCNSCVSSYLSRRLKIFEYQMAQMAAENAMRSGHPSYFKHAGRVALLGAELHKL